MHVYTYQQLQDKIFKIDKKVLYQRICKNIKRIRLEKYEEFKKICNSNTINPYSTENIAALLDYNHNHYKRFESETDSTKRIPLEKLIYLTIIFDTTLDELIK